MIVTEADNFEGNVRYAREYYTSTATPLLMMKQSHVARSRPRLFGVCELCHPRKDKECQLTGRRMIEGTRRLIAKFRDSYNVRVTTVEAKRKCESKYVTRNVGMKFHLTLQLLLEVNPALH